MPKAVLLSIRPRYCQKIISREKTIEVRKDAPDIPQPFKCFMYCTSVKPLSLAEYVDIHAKTGGYLDIMTTKVFGEFMCDKVSTYHCVEDEDGDPGAWIYDIPTVDGEKTALSYEEFASYGKGATLYGWCISDLKIYDEPLEITQFIKPCPYDEICECCDMYFELEDCCKNAALQLRRPPQSWFYVEDGVFSA